MEGEEPIFESEEEVNKELEKMYLATDGEFIITKDGETYCNGKLDKEYGYDIKKLNSEKADKTCSTKHVIPPKSKDSGILPNFT